MSQVPCAISHASRTVQVFLDSGDKEGAATRCAAFMAEKAEMLVDILHAVVADCRSESIVEN